VNLVELGRWCEWEIRFEATVFHFWHFARKEVPLAKFLQLHVWHFVIKFDWRLGAISTRKKERNMSEMHTCKQLMFWGMFKYCNCQFWRLKPTESWQTMEIITILENKHWNAFLGVCVCACVTLHFVDKTLWMTINRKQYQVSNYNL